MFLEDTLRPGHGIGPIVYEPLAETFHIRQVSSPRVHLHPCSRRKDPQGTAAVPGLLTVLIKPFAIFHDLLASFSHAV
ncbi:hypothetical protein A0H81_02105 [Grifola frondosa]|uniref:Uncharacterized protein n=1 Tax=Grifola frondosa TaxID=5627 RepID=A0A1C7MK42_GRIFR|nr:hypothetical protein A0H81_02105 [Grifola frondosa]